MAQRYTLITDGDGHWYVCPVERTGEAAECFAHEDEPDFVHAVGGAPSLVEFTDPCILGVRIDAARTEGKG